MTSEHDVTFDRLNLRVDGVNLDVATVGRAGERPPIVFLHGFGSTKEDYVDIAHQDAFAGRPFLAYDAPDAVTPRATTCRRYRSRSGTVALAESMIRPACPVIVPTLRVPTIPSALVAAGLTAQQILFQPICQGWSNRCT